MKNIIPYTLILIIASCSSMNSRKPASFSQQEINNTKSENFCKNSNLTTISCLQKSLSKTASITQIGPEGNVVLFEIEDKSAKVPILSIKTCQKNRVLLQGSDCVTTTNPTKILYPSLEETLRLILTAQLTTNNPILNDTEAEELKKFIGKYGTGVISMSDFEKLRNLETRSEKLEFIDNLINQFKNALFSNSLEDILYEDENIEKNILYDILTSAEDIANLEKNALVNQEYDVVSAKYINRNWLMNRLGFPDSYEYEPKGTETITYVDLRFIRRIMLLGFAEQPKSSIKWHKKFQNNNIDSKLTCNRSAASGKIKYIEDNPLAEFAQKILPDYNLRSLTNEEITNKICSDSRGKISQYNSCIQRYLCVLKAEPK